MSGRGLSPARRTAGIRPFRAMALLARARELEAAGRDIVHMEIGEPDLGTPAAVTAAGGRALAAGHTRYTPAPGLPPLREALSDWYRRRHGLALDPARIFVTPGASGALQVALALVVDAGDEVLHPVPGYPCNPNFARLLDARPVALQTAAAAGYQPEPEQVEAAWTGRTAALLLASPANPTGAVLDRERLMALVAATAGRGWIVADEIYQGLCFGEPAASALETGAEHVLVVNSFSKYFGMTGWRIGWLVVPQALVAAAERLVQNLFLAAPTLAQYAALAALEPEVTAELDGRVEVYRQRCAWLLPALESLGFRVPAPPRGAFYIYADSAGLGPDSLELSATLLEQAGVAVTSGADFDPERGLHHLRFAFTTGLERLREGVARLEEFLRG